MVVLAERQFVSAEFAGGSDGNLSPLPAMEVSGVGNPSSGGGMVI